MFAFHCGKPWFKFGLLGLCETEGFLSQQEHKCSIVVMQVFWQNIQGKQISPWLGSVWFRSFPSRRPGSTSGHIHLHSLSKWIILHFVFLLFLHITTVCSALNCKGNHKHKWKPFSIKISVGGREAKEQSHAELNGCKRHVSDLNCYGIQCNIHISGHCHFITIVLYFPAVTWLRSNTEERRNEDKICFHLF